MVSRSSEAAWVDDGDVSKESKSRSVREGRLDFTVIGDAVNTAARVESATRQTGDDVLITGATLDLLHSDTDWEARPTLPLKEKTEEIKLYGPRSSPTAQAVRPTRRDPRHD